MHFILILITIATLFSTLLGGIVALHLRDKLHLILGFSAGAILAVAFFDLLPEALALTAKSYAISSVLSVVALGFAAYLILDRFILLHDHTGDEASHNHKAHAGAGSLSLHSFLDGMGIGLAFQVSPAVGGIVATAVLTHDFSDGINTVNFVIKHGGNRTDAFRWLLIDALAPVAGVLSTAFFVLPGDILGLLLALFSGFFIYLGASDLIPESYHSHPKRWTTIMTLLGMAFLYLVIQFARL